MEGSLAEGSAGSLDTAAPPPARRSDAAGSLCVPKISYDGGDSDQEFNRNMESFIAGARRGRSPAALVSGGDSCAL